MPTNKKPIYVSNITVTGYQKGTNDLKTLKKKHLGDIYEKEKDNEGNNLPGFDYWKEKFMKDNNLSEKDAITLIDEIKSEQRLRGISDKIYKYPNAFVKSSQISKPEYVEPYNKYVDMKTLKAKQPEKQTMGEDYFISGAKSVKQYRGDENLPEAKNGMKKCGCKHTRSKYKYQAGERDIAADKLEYGDDYEAALKNNFGKELELPEGDTSVTYAPKTQKVSKTKPVVTRNIDTTKRKIFPTVSGEKKIFIEKTPVTKAKVVPASTDRATEYFNNYAGGDMIPGKKYQLVDGKMVITDNQKWAKKKLAYDWEDLSEGEKNKVNNLYKQKRRDALQKEVDIMNKSMKYRNPVYGNSDKTFLAGQRNKEIKEIQDNVKRITSAVEGKSGYKYGTGAITIPEGSAIVTANKGKNKQALMAYKKGNYKLLNNIIDDMPEDNVDKKQAGSKEVSMFDLSNFTKPTPGFYRATRQGKGYGKYKAPDDETQKQREYEYEKDPKGFEKKYGKIATSLQKERMEAFNAGKEDFTWSDDKKLYKSGLKIPAREAAQNTNLLPNPNLPNGGLDLGKKEDEVKTPDKKKPDNKRKGFDIPSLAEVAARSSILGQGVEGVPENYLKLGRYNYASQLDRILRENAVAANTAKENIRDVSGGSAGSYLSNVANITGKRFDANAGAVTEDTLARQDILNKNVDLGNVEAQVNTGLKNQFAMQRAANRGAYNNQLIALGQGIDTAADASKLMSSQKDADAQRLQILRDAAESGNYQWKQEGNVSSLVPKKKGAKRLKTYKRK